MFQDTPRDHPPGSNAGYPVPISLGVEDLPYERGIEMGQETVPFWWNRSALCSPSRSGEDESTVCAPAATGVGIWTRLA